MKEIKMLTQNLDEKDEAGNALVAVTTMPCMVCSKTSEVVVRQNQLKEWQRGAFIQEAMPQLSVGERELLISGTHPDCWDQLWDEEEVGAVETDPANLEQDGLSWDEATRDE